MLKNGRTREETIDLLFTSTDFSIKFIKKLSDDELDQMWITQEMDEVLSETGDEADNKYKLTDAEPEEFDETLFVEVTDDEGHIWRGRIEMVQV